MCREEPSVPRDTCCPSVMEAVEAGSVTCVVRARLEAGAGGVRRTRGGAREGAVPTTSAMGVSRSIRWVAAETVVVLVSSLSGPGGGRSSGGR